MQVTFTWALQRQFLQGRCETSRLIGARQSRAISVEVLGVPESASMGTVGLSDVCDDGHFLRLCRFRLAEFLSVVIDGST